MENKLYFQTKDTQKLSSVSSNTPVQGMFESLSLVAQRKQQVNSQPPNLKTSLMQTERYGHHLQKVYPIDNNQTSKLQPKLQSGQQLNKQRSSQELPIQRKTFVIGGPAKATTFEQIADLNHPSYDQYIGNAYKYVGGQDQIDNKKTPPLRIPDRFGAREAEGKKGLKNLVRRVMGQHRGTSKHGPKINYQPKGKETQYLKNLVEDPILQEPIVNIVSHATKSGEIGGYKPNDLVKLLINMGLQPGQKGIIDLRGCHTALPPNNKQLAPSAQIQNELKKYGIPMQVRGFKGLVETNQLYEHKNAEYAAALKDKQKAKLV